MTYPTHIQCGNFRGCYVVTTYCVFAEAIDGLQPWNDGLMSFWPPSMANLPFVIQCKVFMMMGVCLGVIENILCDWFFPPSQTRSTSSCGGSIHIIITGALRPTISSIFCPRFRWRQHNIFYKGVSSTTSTNRCQIEMHSISLGHLEELRCEATLSS